MNKDSINVRDEMTATIEHGQDHALRARYVVLTDAGIFKNGKLYKKGDTLNLDDKTAQAFMNKEMHGQPQIKPITGAKHA